jgi:protein phosphatase
MLVCPSCNSQNPEKNKFCQRCGTSLNEKTCTNCDYEHVPYETEFCPQCGHLTGQLWWVSVYPQTSEALPPETTASSVEVSSSALDGEKPEGSELDSSEEPDGSQEVELVAVSAETTESSAAIANSPDNVENSESNAEAPAASEDLSGSYLNPQEKRYKFFDSNRVLDLKPLQITVLSAWLKIAENEDTPNKTATSSQDTDGSAADIPEIAADYLLIKNKFLPSALPLVHDTWQDGDRAVLLLENRSEWPLLYQVWSTPEVDTIKILYWMSQMLELWIILGDKSYRQSLLKIDNLKLDEDETIALQELYPETNPADLKLQALGQVWNELFGQSSKTKFLSLGNMLESLCRGEIEQVGQLQTILENIYEELQPTAVEEENNNLLSDRLSSLPETHSEDTDESPTIILPKRLTGLEDAGVTHPGKQRPYNEDYFAINTRISRAEDPKGENITAKGLYILCDGMGGHAGGEVASQMAVETLKDFFDNQWQNALPDEKTIRESIFLANQELYNMNQKNASSGTGRMGTTLVMLLVHNTQVAIAHVGDSRLYSLTKQDGLQRLTVDHEVGQREIQRGVEESIAYSRPDAYQLTQALGPRDHNFIKPDITFLEINQDTLLILGSDGLTDNDLLENHGSKYLLPLLSAGNDLDRGANKLIELANKYNGHDNITAVLVRVRAAS